MILNHCIGANARLITDMTNIVDLQKAREEREPHMQGRARCLGCKYEWQAVAPLGTVTLECPHCELPQGRFMNLVEDEGMHWTCNCGNQYFSITPQRTYCTVCGDTISGF